MQRMTACEYQQMIQKKDKPSKFRAKRTTIDGITFDSKAEADYYIHLMLLKRIGDITELELQPKFILQDEPRIVYIADFKVTWKDGRQEIIDVKGVQTQAFRLKKKLFAAKYPYLPLTLVKKVNGKFETVR